MDPLLFARLSKLEKLTYICKCRKIKIKETVFIHNDTIHMAYMPVLRGITIGERHNTADDALAQGAELLKKFRMDLKSLKKISLKSAKSAV